MSLITSSSAPLSRKGIKYNSKFKGGYNPKIYNFSFRGTAGFGNNDKFFFHLPKDLLNMYPGKLFYKYAKSRDGFYTKLLCNNIKNDINHDLKCISGRPLKNSLYTYQAFDMYVPTIKVFK